MLNKRILALSPEWVRDSLGIVFFNWIAMICNVAALYALSRVVQIFYVFLGSGQSSTGDLINTVIAAVITVILSLGLRTLCTLRSTDAAFLAGGRIKGRLRGQIFKKLTALGPGYSAHVSTAAAVQLSGEGVDQMESYLGRYVPQLFYSVLAPLTLFGILSVFSFKAGLILFLCVPLIPLSIVVVQKAAKRILAKYWTSYTRLGDSFLENLQGLTTLKIYGADEKRHREMNRQAEDFRKATMRVLVMQMNSITVMDVVAWGGTALAIVLSATELGAGKINLGQALFIILVGSEFFIPMRLLGSLFHTAMNGAAAGDKIFEFLDKTGKRPEAPPVPGPQPAARSNTVRSNTVRMVDLSFAWEKDRPALQHVNLEIPDGSFTALAGESGSGKSTIAAILSGTASWYQGSVTIGGVEISGIPAEELTKTITLVRHNSYIFAGTIRDNLRMAKPAATDEEMLAVLRQLGLGDFLTEREGLETLISEGSANISGGQRQRLAAARALLHDSPVYIFDEAASSVDAESGEAIMAAARALAGKKTVLLITHRLADAEKAEQIAVLDHGKLAALGTHGELMQQGGVYQRMYTEQRGLEAVTQGGGGS
ncbi:MAG: ABC transporter ATP-binding protein/permease [Treponema sp.]|nr:ABC transporter ATP-binding protein/permease [Treponema sp.]